MGKNMIIFWPWFIKSLNRLYPKIVSLRHFSLIELPHTAAHNLPSINRLMVKGVFNFVLVLSSSTVVNGERERVRYSDSETKLIPLTARYMSVFFHLIRNVTRWSDKGGKIEMSCMIYGTFSCNCLYDSVVLSVNPARLICLPLRSKRVTV